VSISKILAAKKKMIPKTGANLVGMDDFEEPGDELYLIAHFPSAQAAEKAQAKRKKTHPGEVSYVYTPDTV
jgi:hypothetical protein